MNKRKQILEKPELGIALDASLKTDKALPKYATHGCKDLLPVTDNISGEILCSSCGQVLEEKSLEAVPLYRSDPMDFMTKKSSGSPTSLAMFDINMSTVMSDRDWLGKYLPGPVKNEFYRLKMLNSRSVAASKTKTLRSALLFLNMLQVRLAIPNSVAEDAAHLFRKAIRARLTVGRKSKNIMCACIYASCKQSTVPRTILEISLASNIGKKSIARTYQSLVERLNLPVRPFNSAEFLAAIATEAKISEKSRRNALEILCAAERVGLADGKNPKALSAASLYLACILNAEHKTQDLIAKASGITATTIRTRYHDLKKFFLEPMES